MKIIQDEADFRPITIVLTKKSEAAALFDLIDKLDHQLNMGHTQAEQCVIRRLSNVRSNMQIIV